MERLSIPGQRHGESVYLSTLQLFCDDRKLI